MKGVAIATVVMVVMAVIVSVAVYLGVKTTRDTYEVIITSYSFLLIFLYS